MLVTRTSVYSGTRRTRDLPITEIQMDCYRQGALAQDAFPGLTPADREFIISGITQEEWDECFKDEENEDV